MSLTRRDLLKSLGVFAAGAGFACGRSPNRSPGADSHDGRKIPLIHTTDLYHPPQDPDDQIDLATVFALEEYDLKAVVLDITERFLHAAPDGFDITREPGILPVSQMEDITGKNVAVALGPIRTLTHPGDRCEDVPEREQFGIRTILETLTENPEPVIISVTGSPRAVTAAFNREPALMSEKTRAILLNAGSTGGEKVEWNVQLDRHAYIGLWRSDLPIHWFPPGTESGAFDRTHERGTYWRAEHADLFRDLPPMVQAYFLIAFSNDFRRDQGGKLSHDEEEVFWQEILTAERNLWSTASLVMGAGRVLARAGLGWRFVPESEAEELETWPWRLDPISAAVDDEGVVSWELVDTASSRRIFGRKPGLEYAAAMAEALNALIRELGSP